jgi:hypothetical protein
MGQGEGFGPYYDEHLIWRDRCETCWWFRKGVTFGVTRVCSVGGRLKAVKDNLVNCSRWKPRGSVEKPKGNLVREGQGW